MSRIAQYVRWGAALGSAALLASCRPPSLLIHDDSDVQLAHTSIAGPSTGDPGSYTVKFLYYGSGSDKNRREYRDSVTIKTRPVNGTAFLRGGDKKLLAARWKYWGFDTKRLPVNARVWYPEGPGPFPLVLIVHGNHDMKKFSDPGYAYLGRHLASHGYIMASVDENFLNGDLRGENDVRGWMLLEHLSAWRQWNAESGNPFFGKVDMSRIALIGHSRGGEAITIAAAFNHLSRYPDDARVAMNFGFNIRTLIAIAPVDGQYLPTDRLTPIKNVNYFVMHGAHDGDVQTMMGMRAYDRVKFTEGSAFVKAALYIYRANHGQFNTVWGNNDVGDSGWLLAKDLLLTGDEQRQIAKVFITGFLDLTLRGGTKYLPMFKDHRAVGTWLPKTVYLSRFEAPTERILADYEEDIDVTTGSASGVTISGSRLATWKEVGLKMRSRGMVPFDNNTVMLGWTAPRGAADTARASYTISLPDTLAYSWKLNAGSALVFDLANYGAKPRPLAPGDTATPSAQEDAVRKKVAPAPKPPALSDSAKKAAAQADSLPLDLTVELLFADGHVAALPLSEIAPIRPPLTSRIWSYDYFATRLNPPAKNHDDILAHYTIPFSRFAERFPGMNPETIRAIRFRFDRGPAGTILLDDVGFDLGTAP
ncbi:MAG: alpha/beta hydrolase family protein [Gemmatimonadales bacterium]